MLHRSLFVAVAVACIAVASADVHSCGGNPPYAPDHICADFTEGLFNSAGLNFAAVTEMSSNEVAINGVPQTATVEFDFVGDTGAFEFCFGVCRVPDLNPAILNAILAGGASPALRKQFALDCILNNGHEIFNDELMNAGHAVNVSLDVPSELIFFLIPDNTVAEFVSNTDNFYAPDGQNSIEPTPLFSLSEANPGEKDQLLIFTDGEKSLLSWEDKQIAPGSPEGASDSDFSDLTFTLDFELVSDVPGPCARRCNSVAQSYPSGHPSTYQGATAQVQSQHNCACIRF